MKIRIIQPIITREPDSLIKSEFAPAARPDTELSVSTIERGPASIESQYDVAVALPDILINVRRAQEEGADAIIINCMADPGLDAAREIASIPVIGLGEASLHLASMLAHKFSVVTILDRDIPDLDRMLRKYALLSRVASIRPINVPVLDLRDNEEAVTRAAIEAAERAVGEDGAAAIAFGCSGLSGTVKELAAAFREMDLRVPVINPASAGIKLAESLVDMGLLYSKLTYPYPPEKKIIFP
ncbi:MAG: aspartate/glutamate racemase family protein [Candidatus Promineofilum sp.]|nr:aspartate/glutamate racemase family protein [Promineifilum sp.]